MTPNSSSLRTKLISGEFSLYTALFLIGSFFPIFHLYHWDYEYEFITRTEHHYISTLLSSHLYPVFFSIVLLAFLSKKRNFLVSISIVAISLTVFLGIFCWISTILSGIGRINISYDTGFWLVNLAIILLASRTLVLVKHFEQLKLPVALSKWSFVLAIAAMAGSVIYFFILTWLKL